MNCTNCYEGQYCEPCQARVEAEYRAGWNKHMGSRANKEAAALEAHKAAGCPDDGLTCSECCEHEFDMDEGGMCLNCGDDGADHLASMIDYATDMAKDGT